MSLTLILLALATLCATFLGGLFALSFRDKSHLIIGFSAGAVIGVAFFDLIPEAFELGSTYGELIPLLIAVGFIAYLILDRMIGGHNHDHNHKEHGSHEHEQRGMLRASSLSIHSLLDGMGIGFAFQVSPVLGSVVAVAVLAHSFSDGINTVSAILKSGGAKARALGWLAVDALAPALGIFITLFISVSESTLAIIIALFCGSFLYLGASDLVPESYHNHPTKWTTIMTILGAALIYFIIHLAH